MSEPIDFEAIHVEWKVPKAYYKDFELAAECFIEAGFGDLEMQIMTPTEESSAISFYREGSGQPAIYAAYFAFCVNETRGKVPDQKGFLLTTIKDKLLYDPETQEMVMSRSISRSVQELRRVIAVTEIESTALQYTSQEDFKSILFENLSTHMHRGGRKED